MIIWIKKNIRGIVTGLVLVSISFWLQSCEPQVQSLITPKRMVTRAELELELDNLIALAQLRMLNLDKQEQLRSLIINNSLILASGQPFNPIGILTGLAGIYGVAHAATKSTKYVTKTLQKRKVNNA